MDEFRKFRFFIPTFWFLALILSAACTNVDATREFIEAMENPFENVSGNDTQGKLVLEIISALAAGGFIVFTAGYLIGSLAITSASLVGCLISVLRWICMRLNRTKLHESSSWNDWLKSDKNFHWETGTISNEDREKLEKAIGYENGNKKFSSLYVVDAYHHGILTNGIANLFTRRWTLFMIGMNCLAALAAFLAAVAALWWNQLLPRYFDLAWWLIASVLAFSISILWNTLSAWWYVRRMTQLILQSDNIPWSKK